MDPISNLIVWVLKWAYLLFKWFIILCLLVGFARTTWCSNQAQGACQAVHICD